MPFVESPVFTADVLRLLRDDEYAALQSHLAAHPTSGALIVGTAGLRKIRWYSRGRGKRGGVRVIYYYVDAKA